MRWYVEALLGALFVLALACCGEKAPANDWVPSPEAITHAVQNATEIRVRSVDPGEFPPPLAISNPAVLAELTERFDFKQGWTVYLGVSGEGRTEVQALVDGKVAAVFRVSGGPEENIKCESPDSRWTAYASLDEAFYTYLIGLVPQDPEAVAKFYRAVEQGDTEAVASLLEQGRGPGCAMATDGLAVYTPGESALRNGQADTARYLVTEAGFEDVHALAALDEVTLLERLLDEKPWAVNAVDWDGRTPLHWAASYGGAAAAELLLVRGAGTESKGHWGLTPLQVAARNGQKGVVEALLRHGADANVLSDEGPSVLDLASQHPDVADLLREHGALTSQELRAADRTR